jgi:Domain of unknown function (DUF4174)
MRFAILLCLLALALPVQAETLTAVEAAPLVIVPAAEVDLDALLFTQRPVVVFADSPNDPNYRRQMQLIDREPGDLAERDVIVITDTDPAGMSPLRKELRPRGFSLVILDKDLKPIMRKPLPWDVREIAHAIDKFPLRRQEVLERNPAGR